MFPPCESPLDIELTEGMPDPICGVDATTVLIVAYREEPDSPWFYYILYILCDEHASELVHETRISSAPDEFSILSITIADAAQVQ